MLIEIKSPCVEECALENLICTGCFRTADEIKYWRTLSDKQKVNILDKILIRKNEKKTIL